MNPVHLVSQKNLSQAVVNAVVSCSSPEKADSVDTPSSTRLIHFYLLSRAAVPIPVLDEYLVPQWRFTNEQNPTARPRHIEKFP